MIADAFIRQARVAIAPPGIVLTQELRIGFDLQLDAQRDPPPSVLTLTNLAEATTARLVKPASVEIQVGYRGHPLAEIYAGDVARIEHKMEGRDRVTRIRLGPRDRGTRTATILASSYQGTVPLRTIVQDIGERLGIPLGSLDALPNVHVPDFASFDKAEDALTDLLRPRGVEWYEAGGALPVPPARPDDGHRRVCALRTHGHDRPPGTHRQGDAGADAAQPAAAVGRARTGR